MTFVVPKSSLVWKRVRHPTETRKGFPACTCRDRSERLLDIQRLLSVQHVQNNNIHSKSRSKGKNSRTVEQDNSHLWDSIRWTVQLSAIHSLVCIAAGTSGASLCSKITLNQSACRCLVATRLFRDTINNHISSYINYQISISNISSR